ncbi:MAG: peptidoglycan binding domain-containing protein, partial [Clostridia bacterium]
MKRYIKKIKIGDITGVIIILAVALAAAGMFFTVKKVDALLAVDVIRENVFIDRVDVGGLTTEEAYEKVTRIYREKYDDLQYRVVWQQVEQSVTLKDIGYSFTCDNAVDRAYSIGKEARLFRKVLRLFMPPTPVYLTSDFCYNAENLEAFVDLVASEIYSPYANNRYGIIGDSLVVYLGSPLQEMNKEA